jgi:hypothetical protein
MRVRDVPAWPFTFYKDVSSVEGFSEEVEANLQQLKRTFTDYKIAVIRIKGVEVSEVCEIFERINQEGKKLDPVDIIVARTYRNEDPDTDTPGFYLREHLERLRGKLVHQGSRFQELEDLTIIQMVAMCLRKEGGPGRSSLGITPSALDNLTTKDFEEHWADCQETVLETIKFLHDQKLQGPGMLPFGYLALPICYHLHRNPSPNRDVARQWFWRSAFGLENFRHSGDVYRQCEEFFLTLEDGKQAQVPPLTLSRARLVQTSYAYRNALSRAVLAFLANQTPLDFSDPQAVVLDNVYLLLTQAPNLHHIYPYSFLRGVEGLPPDVSPHSLMNICFLRACTNIEIGDANPLTYFRKYEQVREFQRILDSHLIPRDYIERDEFSPEDYREFLFARADWLADSLKAALPDVEVSIVD